MRPVGSQAQGPWDGSPRSRASVPQPAAQVLESLLCGVAMALVWLCSLLFALVCLEGLQSRLRLCRAAQLHSCGLFALHSQTLLRAVHTEPADLGEHRQPPPQGP